LDDAIEDGVSECRFADHLVPCIQGELAGDQRRAAAMALLDDLHQIAPLTDGEPVRPKESKIEPPIARSRS
jgi:hypothetical protein